MVQMAAVQMCALFIKVCLLKNSQILFEVVFLQSLSEKSTFSVIRDSAFSKLGLCIERRCFVFVL